MPQFLVNTQTTHYKEMANYGKLATKVLFATSIVFLVSCQNLFNKKDQSRTTGWNYNDPKNGGFEVSDYSEPITGPGLVFIEGGTFTMGRISDDPMFEWNNIPRRVTIPSFYMDEPEVSNLDYV